MKNIIRNSLFALFTFSTAAFAATGANDTQGSFLLSLFIGFFALILVFQIVPAFLLFVGMVRGLINPDRKEVTGIKN